MSQAVMTMSARIVKRTHYRWYVLALTFVVLTLASADRANIGIVLPYMQKEFDLSNTQVGAVVSLFGLGRVCKG